MPSRMVTPVTRPVSSRTTPVAVRPKRTSAPAARAASTINGSSTVRRGAYNASTPAAGRIGTDTGSPP